MADPAQHESTDGGASRIGLPLGEASESARIELTGSYEPGGAVAVSSAADLKTMHTTMTPAATPSTHRRGRGGPVSRIRAVLSAQDGYGAMTVRLLKSSGIYALAAMASPLISLVLTPFLTHHLTRTDYGIFAAGVTVIQLATGISQLGLGSSFFRTYNYDYTEEHDRQAVLATTVALLLVGLTPVIVVSVFASPFLANLMLGRSTLGPTILLIAGVVVVQNLSLPAFVWMRAGDHALTYSLLSFLNLSVNLGANILLVGVLQWGIAGALISIGLGYASVVVVMFPRVLIHSRLRVRWSVAYNLITFGVPIVGGMISYWILQLSDRELLLHILGPVKGPPVVGSYSVAYVLGGVLSTLIIGPFQLAWPTTMYAIAKRPDAARVFSLIFRYFSLVLLFAAFGLSLLSTLLLDVLFPKSYQSAALVIPVIALSIACYGVYILFIIGVSIRKMTILAMIYVTSAALANIGLNLVLIPHFAAMGAAVSTLVAYVLMATFAYFVNRRIYPIPFEVGRFVVAVLIGVSIFVASYVAAQMADQTLGSWARWPLSGVGLLVFAGCLVIIGRMRGAASSQQPTLG